MIIIISRDFFRDPFFFGGDRWGDILIIIDGITIETFTYFGTSTKPIFTVIFTNRQTNFISLFISIVASVHWHLFHYFFYYRHRFLFRVRNHTSIFLAIRTFSQFECFIQICFIFSHIN